MSLFFHFYVAIRNRNVSLTAIWLRNTKPLHSIEVDGMCYIRLVSFILAPTTEKWYKFTRVVCTYIYTIVCVCFLGMLRTLERILFLCVCYSTGTMQNTSADANWHFYGTFIVKSGCLSVFLVSAKSLCALQVFVNLLKFTWPNFEKSSLCSAYTARNAYKNRSE